MRVSGKPASCIDILFVPLEQFQHSLLAEQTGTSIVFLTVKLLTIVLVRA